MEQEDTYDKHEYPETTTNSNAGTGPAKPSYHFPHFNSPLDKVPVPPGYPKDYGITSTDNNVT